LNHWRFSSISEISADGNVEFLRGKLHDFVERSSGGVSRISSSRRAARRSLSLSGSAQLTWRSGGGRVVVLPTLAPSGGIMLTQSAICRKIVHTIAGVPMPVPVFSDRVAAVRSFNRFFTRQIGVLREGLLHSEFTLTEMRVLYELAHHGDQPSAALCRDLG
jgi:hypothetical protein